MQQPAYNRLNLIQLGLVAFCTIVASLVLVYFLAPIIMFGGGPFGMGVPPTVPDHVYADIEKEIMERESVLAFKETHPDHRERIEQDYGVEYTIQARNQNTGNVLALHVSYYPIGPPGSTDKFQDDERLQCIPGEGIVGPEMMMGPRGLDSELFLDERIRETDCLDDDWKPVVISRP